MILLYGDHGKKCRGRFAWHPSRVHSVGLILCSFSEPSGLNQPAKSACRQRKLSLPTCTWTDWLHDRRGIYGEFWWWLGAGSIHGVSFRSLGIRNSENLDVAETSFSLVTWSSFHYSSGQCLSPTSSWAFQAVVTAAVLRIMFKGRKYSRFLWMKYT